MTLAAGSVRAILLEVVSEKTGYPAEMLEPGMQLDADLGIDSIKRVEILSALQEQLPDAPVIKPEHLGTLQTLADIVEFLAAEGAEAEEAGAMYVGGNFATAYNKDSNGDPVAVTVNYVAKYDANGWSDLGGG